MESKTVTVYKPVITFLAVLALLGSSLLFHQNTQAQSGSLRLERVIEPSDLGLARVRGLSYDAGSGSFTVYDGQNAVRLDRYEHPIGSTPAQAFAGQALKARHPVTGSLFTVDPAARVVSESAPSGRQAAVYDLAEFSLADPVAAVFAPSGDQTDDPAELSLYIVDAGSALRQSGIYEFSFVTATSIAPLAPPADVTLVNLFQTWNWTTPSSDPSGVDYVPSLNALIITDSEIDELAISQGKNIYLSDTAGNLQSTCSLLQWTDEPTGITYDAAGGRVFVSDDIKDKIFVINIGPDGIFCTNDDTSTSFDTTAFGSDDSEGVGYGAGKLFIGGGINHEVYIVDPGPNQVFDGVTPTGDDVVTSFDTAIMAGVEGVLNIQGVTYDDTRGTLWIVGRGNNRVAQVTLGGTLIQLESMYSFLLLDPIDGIPGGTPDGIATDNNLAGITVGLSQDPNLVKLFIADRGIDNTVDLAENDGQIWEFDVVVNQVKIYLPLVLR